MKTLHLKEDLKLEGNLEIGYVDLYDRGGNKHHHIALDVPGYGLVPCAKKLEDDFTTATKDLALVITDDEDENPPYTSNIWITRSTVLHFGNWDELGRECDDERDEDGDTEDQDLEALFDSFDDPKKAAWMRLYYYSSNPQPIGFSGILLAKRQNSFYCTYFLHNRNVADTKSPYPIKRLEVIRWFNQKSMVFNQSLS